MDKIVELFYAMLKKGEHTYEYPNWLENDRKKLTSMLSPEQNKEFINFELSFQDYIEDCEKEIIKAVVDYLIEEE